MNKQTIYIEGNNFSTLQGFYDEIERVLTKGLDWKIGRNLNVFNDVLRGGFGMHEYEDPIKLFWSSSGKSGEDLGFDGSAAYYRGLLPGCHPSAREKVLEWLEDAENHKGQTLFDIIIEIIQRHEHIELVLA